MAASPSYAEMAARGTCRPGNAGHLPATMPAQSLTEKVAAEEMARDENARGRAATLHASASAEDGSPSKRLRVSM